VLDILEFVMCFCYARKEKRETDQTVTVDLTKLSAEQRQELAGLGIPLDVPSVRINLAAAQMSQDAREAFIQIYHTYNSLSQ